MPGALAEAQDVADIWRPLSAAQTTQADALCLKASDLLRQRLPSVDDRIGLFTTDPTDRAALAPTVVADVVATMVKRVMSNVDGVWNESTTAGPFSKSKTFVGSRGGASLATVLGELVVTDADVAKLTPVDTPGQPASFTIKPTLAPDTCSAALIDDGLFTDPIEPGVIYGPYYG